LKVVIPSSVFWLGVNWFSTSQKNNIKKLILWLKRKKFIHFMGLISMLLKEKILQICEKLRKIKTQKVTNIFNIIKKVILLFFDKYFKFLKFILTAILNVILFFLKILWISIRHPLKFIVCFILSGVILLPVFLVLTGFIILFIFGISNLYWLELIYHNYIVVTLILSLILNKFVDLNQENSLFDNVFSGSLKPINSKYYLSSSWGRIRRQKLKEENNTCEICGSQEHLQVHHKTYLRFGGNEKMEDLQVLCEDCHQKKHPDKNISSNWAN
jgi:hypothetical protein